METFDQSCDAMNDENIWFSGEFMWFIPLQLLLYYNNKTKMTRVVPKYAVKFAFELLCIIFHILYSFLSVRFFLLTMNVYKQLWWKILSTKAVCMYKVWLCDGFYLRNVIFKKFRPIVRSGIISSSEFSLEIYIRKASEVFVVFSDKIWNKAEPQFRFCSNNGVA